MFTFTFLKVGDKRQLTATSDTKCVTSAGELQMSDSNHLVWDGIYA